MISSPPVQRGSLDPSAPGQHGPRPEPLERRASNMMKGGFRWLNQEKMIENGWLNMLKLDEDAL